MGKKGLGRGLGALLDAGAVVETTTENEKDVKKIKITQIEPNKSQPRTDFDEEKIEELAGVSTIADGIAVKKPGGLTFELCQKYVDEVIQTIQDKGFCQ